MDDESRTDQTEEQEEQPGEPILAPRTAPTSFDLVKERTVEPLWVIGLVIVLPLLAILVVYLARLIMGS